MRFRERGLSTGAFVGIIVVIVVVSIGAYFLVIAPGGQRGGVGGLPVYGGATKSDTVGTMGSVSDFVEIMSGGTDLPEDVAVEVYVATGSVSDILSFYRTEMINTGWTKLCDNTSDFSILGMSGSMGFLYFEKTDRAAAVYAVDYTYEGEHHHYFVLVEGPKAVFEEWMGSTVYEVPPTEVNLQDL